VCVMQKARSSLAREMEVWTLEGSEEQAPFIHPHYLNKIPGDPLPSLPKSISGETRRDA
jgi:hypothetical protein